MRIGIIILCLIALFSCKRKEPTTWNIDLVSPIIKSSLTIDDLLPDSVRNTNPDSSINLNYTYTVDALDGQNIVNLANDTLSQFISFPFPNAVSFDAGNQFANNTVPSTFQYGDARITELKINNGTIEVFITNDIESDIITTFSILKSSDNNGNVFTKTVRIPAANNGLKGVFQSEFMLNSFTFDLTDDGTDYNTIVTATTAILDPNGNGANISSQDSLSINYILKDLSPNALKGYLGDEFIQESGQEANFDVFDRIASGSFDIDDISVDLKVSNYVGADLQLKLLNLDAINSNTASTLSLNHPVINQQLNLNRGTFNWMGITPAVKTFNLTPLNSNIDLMIESMPNKLGYGFELQINPLGNVSNGTDFLFFKNTLELALSVYMPLRFIANDLVLVDTTTLNFNSENNPIKNGTFTLFAENGFPFDADVQVYILDNNNQVIDSIMDNTFIASGTVDAQDKVISSSKNTLSSSLTAEKIALLEQNNKVVVKSKFNTVGANHVTLYDHYKLDIKLIGDINYEASI